MTEGAIRLPLPDTATEQDRSIAERIVSRSEEAVPPADDLALPVVGNCWVWTGHTTRFGHGKITIGGRRGRDANVHREVMRILGHQIDGLDVDHRCRNPKCFNPAHLEAVSRSENVRRGKLFAFRDGRCPRCDSTDIADAKSGRWCRPCTNAKQRARYVKKGGPMARDMSNVDHNKARTAPTFTALRTHAAKAKVT